MKNSSPTSPSSQSSTSTSTTRIPEKVERRSSIATGKNQIGWNARKSPHTGVTARKGRNIEILHDAVVKEAGFLEKCLLCFACCSTYQHERSYLLVREDGIDSNCAIQPCWGFCPHGEPPMEQGNGYGVDIFTHMAFDGCYFNDTCNCCILLNLPCHPFSDTNDQENPECFYIGGNQPANPEVFITVLNKGNLNKKKRNKLKDSSKDSKSQWKNRQIPHDGVIALRENEKEIKILYDAELDDISCREWLPLLLCGGFIFDVDRSYVYIREDGFEINTSYQVCCGICGPSEHSNGCGIERRQVIHWDSYYFNSALKPCVLDLQDSFLAMLSLFFPPLEILNQVQIPLCLFSSEKPKFEVVDTNKICCSVKLCDNDKSLVYIPFEVCPFPLCFMQNRVSALCNCGECCGNMTNSPIIYERFGSKFRAPKLANPEEFMGAIAQNFPKNYAKREINLSPKSIKRIVPV